MGGSVGRTIDDITGFLPEDSGLGTNLEAEGNKIWGTMKGEKPEEVVTETESQNPYSTATLSNSTRRLNKSGFGRRQTFKGLTG